MNWNFDFKLAHICGKKKLNVDLHFPGGLSSGLAHICASGREAPKPWVVLLSRGTRRRSGLICIPVIKDIVIVVKMWIRGCYIFNCSSLKECKALLSEAPVLLLAAHPHLRGAQESLCWALALLSWELAWASSSLQTGDFFLWTSVPASR